MTPATDAAREARAREIAWKLVIGEKVGGGDGQTYVGRTPTVREVEAALLAFADTEAASQPREGETGRFWLIVREPGMVPDRKGPWPHRDTAKVLREFIAARPRAFLDVLTVDAGGTPWVEHGPQTLQIADGRSMSVGRKHNARVRAAAEEALTQRPPEQAGAVPVGWKLVPIDPTKEIVDAMEAVEHPNNHAAFYCDLYAAMLSAAPTPPDAGPGEIPAGMVAWHGGDSAPVDWDGQDAMRRDGRREKPRRWFHDPVHPYADIIAYTPKAPPQTPPDAGIGSDGAGEKLAPLVRGIAQVIRMFPHDKAWGGADQAEQVADILDRAVIALATQPGDGG